MNMHARLHEIPGLAQEKGAPGLIPRRLRFDLQLSYRKVMLTAFEKLLLPPASRNHDWKFQVMPEVTDVW